MDKKIKKQWVEALRSGKYQQMRGGLMATRWNRQSNEYNQEPSYCCLGVLCHITNRLLVIEERPIANVPGTVKKGYSMTATGKKPNAPADGYPTPSLVKSVGLTWNQATVLAKLNDHGKPFTEIADYIEENL